MTTLIVYPDAGSGATTCDGIMVRSGVTQTLANIIAGAGTGVATTDASTTIVKLYSTTTTNLYAHLYRAGYTFDTSSISAGATISSATLSLFGTGKANGVGSLGIDIVSFAPAANNTLASADFAVANFGATPKATCTYANWSATAYNDFTLAAGDITKAGITKFGARSTFDTAGSGDTWASAVTSSITGYFADQTGTTNDPVLTVVYTADITTKAMFYARMRQA